MRPTTCATDPTREPDHEPGHEPDHEPDHEPGHDVPTRHPDLVRPMVEVEIDSGPGCTEVTALRPGRHVIGRAPGAAVRVDDPDVEPHHLLLDVAVDGRVSVFHLTGRLPVLADDEPVVGWVGVGAGSVIDLGATRLRLTLPSAPPEPPHTGEVPGDPWQRMLVRTPRAVPFLALPGVDPPPVTGDGTSTPAPGGMLVGAATGLVGGLVMAWVTGSAIAALFGVVAGTAAVATWTVAHIRRVRERRRRHRADQDSRATFEAAVASSADRIRDHHVATVVSVSRRLTAPDDHALWSRRAEHGDAFTVTLGRGDLDRPVPLAATTPETSSAPVGDTDLLSVVERHRTLRDVQVPAALDAGSHEVVAVEGTHSAAVVRSIVLQLAVTTGPADCCLRAVARDRRAWEWVERLPHANLADGRSGVADADDPLAVSELVVGLDDGDHRRVVIVCDAPGLLATRTGPLRRSLDGDRPVTILLAVSDGSGLPAVCRSALRLGSGGRGGDRWVADLHDNAAVTAWAGVRVHASGVSMAVAERTAARLARFVDPEDPSTAAGRVPTTLRLDELTGVPQTEQEVVAAWRAGGRDPDLAAEIGASADGVIEVDLVRDGPHGLVAGTTGSGKSELLRTLVVSLAARVSPEHLSFVLVDYKGGATFDACARLPHTVAVVTDLDAGLAERALVSLDAELHRRERLLRVHGAADLTEYRALAHTEPLARMVVVIDEFAALATELPDFLSALVGVAQRGRSLGVHLLLATQRPAGVVDDAIRANTNLRIALRLHDVSDAVDVVGDPSPAGFARGLPGRSMLRLGPGEVVEFQSAGCTAPRPDGRTNLAELVAAIVGAASTMDVPPSHRPWLPPLDEVTIDDVEPGAVGVMDDPVGQCRRPLVWSASGNLALVGALGAGTTTTLVALARAIATRGDVTLQVIDGRGDTALDPLADLPACSGVVRLHERERLGRLLRRLVGAIDDRRAGTALETGHVEILLVDGLAAVRRALDEPGFADEAAALDRVLAEGSAIGVVTAAVVEADGGVSTLARFADRWVFHLDDTATGAVLGVPAARVPGPVPGRLVVASSGLVAQVIPPPEPATPAGADGVGPSAPPLPVLPRHVTTRDLRAAAREVGSASAAEVGPVAVGLRFDDLGLATLDIAPGDRLAIAGPPGSGRSGVLLHLLDVWCERYPDHDVAVLVGSERSPLADSPSRCELPELAELCELGERRERGDADREHRGAPDRPAHRLVVVDDAERVHDEHGHLAELVGARRSGSTTVMIAGRADALRSGFDHWTAPIRRARLGVVMAATSELDADVLGVVPPRRCPIPARPGLGWLIQHGTSTLAQLVTGSP